MHWAASMVEYLVGHWDAPTAAMKVVCSVEHWVGHSVVYWAVWWVDWKEQLMAAQMVDWKVVNWAV